MADLLGGPRAIRVRGHAQRVHGPIADLQHEEHRDPLEPHHGSPRGRSRRPPSLTPGRAGTAALSCRCPGPAPEVSAAAWRTRRIVEAPTRWPSVSTSPWISLVSPAPVLPGHALDQRGHRVLDGWTPDAVWIRPFLGDQVMVPTRDRARRDQAMPPRHQRQPSGERGEHRSIRPVPAGLGVSSARHGDFVTQHQELDVLGHRRTGKQQHQVHQLTEDQVATDTYVMVQRMWGGPTPIFAWYITPTPSDLASM